MQKCHVATFPGDQRHAWKIHRANRSRQRAAGDGLVHNDIFVFHMRGCRYITFYTIIFYSYVVSVSDINT
jgi:hypothetical protein